MSSRAITVSAGGVGGGVFNVFLFNAGAEVEEEAEDRSSSSLMAASLALARSLESSPLASRRDRRERSRSARDIDGIERKEAGKRNG